MDQGIVRITRAGIRKQSRLKENAKSRQEEVHATFALVIYVENTSRLETEK